VGGVAGRRKKGKKRIWQYDMQQPMSTPLKMKRGRALWSGQSGSTRRAGLADWSKQTGGRQHGALFTLSIQAVLVPGRQQQSVGRINGAGAAAAYRQASWRLIRRTSIGERRERDPPEKRGEERRIGRRQTEEDAGRPVSLDLATITIERARAMQARHIAMTSDLFRPGPFTSHNKTGDQEKERKKGPGAMAGMVSIADLPSIAWPGTGTGVSSLP
jgi:hypothetical protein